MIEVTRLDNSTLFVPAENIQSLQSTPDTVIAFTNNMKMAVREPLEEISMKIVRYHRLFHNKDSSSVWDYYQHASREGIYSHLEEKSFSIVHTLEVSKYTI